MQVLFLLFFLSNASTLCYVRVSVGVGVYLLQDPNNHISFQAMNRMSCTSIVLGREDQVLQAPTTKIDGTRNPSTHRSVASGGNGWSTTSSNFSSLESCFLNFG